jgi:hypothetical protein
MIYDTLQFQKSAGNERKRARSGKITRRKERCIPSMTTRKGTGWMK